MTITFGQKTFEVPPRIEEMLRQEAARRGLEPAEYLGTLIMEAANPLHGNESKILWSKDKMLGDRAQAYLAWAAQHRIDIPVIPLSSLDREQLYEERL